jgi:opacity protein-like surface antigen
MGINIGFGGFFSNYFGGGVKIPEIYINNIRIPETEMKTSWIGGGVKGFLDVKYAEADISLIFGDGDTEIATIKVDQSFIALSFGLFGKYPIKLTDNISIFPIAGIDYQRVLSIKIDGENISDAGDDNALWFKSGVGMDIAVSETMFIRPVLLYGIKLASKRENYSVRPVISGGKEGSTLLGHGFTFSASIGFKL